MGHGGTAPAPAAAGRKLAGVPLLAGTPAAAEPPIGGIRLRDARHRVVRRGPRAVGPLPVGESPPPVVCYAVRASTESSRHGAARHRKPTGARQGSRAAIDAVRLRQAPRLQRRLHRAAARQRRRGDAGLAYRSGRRPRPAGAGQRAWAVRRHPAPHGRDAVVHPWPRPLPHRGSWPDRRRRRRDEATLRLLPQPGVADALPVGGSGRIPVSNPIDPNEADAAAPAQGADWKYWFTAFAPEDEEDAVWRTIGDWSRAHRGALRPNRGRIGPLQDGHTIGYRCLVRRKAPTPPLPPLPPENAHTKISGFPLPRE